MKADPSSTTIYHQLSDEALIALVLCSGAEQAYTALVRRYERLLEVVIGRYLSDPEAVKEVRQDTFIRAFRALAGFRGESKFSTWLCKIATSVTISRLRTRRYDAWAALEDVPACLEAHSYDGGTALETSETHAMLHQAIGQLNPQDAVALNLFYLREQSIEEIGQLTGWTKLKIRSRLCRARQRLRSVLEARV